MGEHDRQDESRDAVVRLENVRKTYRSGSRAVEALRGIDLVIDEPGFYGIMGPSGSGKSTLLHLMAALDSPDDGRITISGSRLEQLSERELTMFRRRRIGIVFQQFNLISTLNALDNVTLPAMLDGMPRGERTRRGEALLHRLGLGDRMTHRPDALSGGEQQRVAIARALVFEPALLLADEPTGNLDSATSRHLWSLLAEIARERNLTVVMVTHEPSAAMNCRRVALLRDGRIEEEFDVDGMGPAELAARTQFAPR